MNALSFSMIPDLLPISHGVLTIGSVELLLLLISVAKGWTSG